MWSLEELGWDEGRAAELGARGEAGLQPARTAVGHRGAYELLLPRGPAWGELAGKLRHEAAPGGLPAVGDWVAVTATGPEPAVIHAVLPRRGTLSRGSAGRATAEQVVAANVDVLFLVAGLDGNFNLRRLERMAVMARESGARPVVLLTKADVGRDVPARLRAVEEAGLAADAVSAMTGEGLEAVLARLGPGVTGALVGSSGVGKSTLVNRLLGEERLATAEVRAADSKGRHTTTRRELLVLPDRRGLIIDSPGLRELQLWTDEEALGPAFADLEELAAGCRYRDCHHATEPGCAVRSAVEDGRLAPGRLENYGKLRRELRHLAARQEGQARREETRRWRTIHKAARRHRPRE